jgi:hypothetical protein
MVRVAFLVLVLALLAVVPASGQVRELQWWSIPYGDQQTCGGPDFTQVHIYEWCGDRPEFIYILVTGPHTYDFVNGVFVPHYQIINVFPAVWEWEVQNCDADYRECWIFGRVKNSMWDDAISCTNPIGYEIQLHYLEPGFYDGADHHMAATYGLGDYVQINAGVGMYDAGGCTHHYDVWLPAILRD